jgi:glycosyltransferase involved in cell wall biosynthesis
MFSFLTSAYQTEQYIRETIDSVLAQTRPDWQLVVVDNGFSDEMAAIVGEYTSDPRIVLIRQQNAGMGGGVNAAAAVATGRYVCPLDSDDLLERDYCERIGELLDSEPAIDAVGADATLFWDATPTDRYFASIGRGVIDRGEYFDSIGRRDIPDPRRSVSFAEMLEKGVPHYAGAFRRDLWHAHGGFEPTADVEADAALWLRLAAAGSDIRVLPTKLVRHRMRALSLSHDLTTLGRFEKRLMDAYLLVGRECGLSEAELAKSRIMRLQRQHRALCAARSALLERDLSTARTAAHEAFRQRPTLRSAVVLTMLYVSPGVLRVMHPIKNRAENAARRLRFAGAVRHQRAISEGRL